MFSWRTTKVLPNHPGQRPFLFKFSCFCPKFFYVRRKIENDHTANSTAGQGSKLFKGFDSCLCSGFEFNNLKKRQKVGKSMEISQPCFPCRELESKIHMKLLILEKMKICNSIMI